MSTQREADLLEAMKYASLPEQRRLAAELEEIRAEAGLEAEADRDTDLANAIIEDHLTPVMVHGMHSTATDWLGEDVSDYTTADLHDIGNTMRTEASVWYASVPDAVKDDRAELREQARGIARRQASQYGSVANQAADIFMEYVGKLVTAEGTDLAGTDSAAGPTGRPGGEDWSAGAPTDPPASGSTAPETNAEGLNAPDPSVSGAAPDEPSDDAPTATRSLPTEDTHNDPGNAASTSEIPPATAYLSAQQRANRQYLGTEEGQEFPVPGERDPEQDGEAASSLPIGVDVTGAPDSFPNFMEPTPSKPAPSTRAPQLSGSASSVYSADRDPWAKDGEEEENDDDMAPHAATSSRRTAVSTGPNPQGSFVYDPIEVEAKGYEEGFAYALTWEPGKPVPAAMTSAATIGNKYNAEYVTGYKSGVTEGIATLSQAFQDAYTAAHKQQVLSSKTADANTRQFDSLDQEVAFPFTWSQTSGVPSSTGDRPGGGQGAADVANVPTPGKSVADYPQPGSTTAEPAVGTDVTKTEPVLDTEDDVPAVVGGGGSDHAADPSPETAAPADPEKLAAVRALVASRLGFSRQAVKVAPYKSRDLGYGSEEGEVELPAKGGADWTGKKEYKEHGTGNKLYLFDDEVHHHRSYEARLVTADDRPVTDIYDDALHKALDEGKSMDEASEIAEKTVERTASKESVKREAHPFKAANEAVCSGPGTPGHTEAGQPHCYWCNEHWDHPNHDGKEVEKNRRMWASKTAGKYRECKTCGVGSYTWGEEGGDPALENGECPDCADPYSDSKRGIA